MRPFFKTWLTICLLMPLAAHATNREQRLPNVNGFTPKVHSTPSTAKSAKPTVSRPTQLSKAHGKTTPGLMAANTKQSSTVLSRAVNVLGTPYRWGGSSPSKGFDCSGLVKYAFNDVAAVDLPRTSNAMAAASKESPPRSRKSSFTPTGRAGTTASRLRRGPAPRGVHTRGVGRGGTGW